MRAKRYNGAGLRMIARVFDDDDARDAAARSTSTTRSRRSRRRRPRSRTRLAEGTRTIHVNSTGSADGRSSCAVCVWQGDRGVDAAEIADWHACGSPGPRAPAARRPGALPVVPAPLACGDLAVLAGPGEALARATAPAR